MFQTGDVVRLVREGVIIPLNGTGAKMGDEFRVNGVMEKRCECDRVEDHDTHCDLHQNGGSGHYWLFLEHDGKRVRGKVTSGWFELVRKAPEPVRAVTSND